ncbi:MAG: pyridoxal phosphate-dependent aminotransferase [Acidobacteriota bacterium]|nr:pyridoxal phosphate-dependent aminotransferase [Acidobacteriota bacterium]
MRLAGRVGRLLTESAFDVLVRARALEAQGRDVIHLEIGEPDFPTPAHIVEAGKRALDEGYTHYGPTQGLPELREAIAESVSRTRGIAARPEHVCVVPGGKPILFFPMLALLEPGDEVIYPNPGFPIYESLIRFLEAVPVPMSSGTAPRFSGRTKLVILNSPGNPTGAVLDRPLLEGIAAEVLKRDCMVLSDEIYSRIWYDEPPFSIASLPGMLDRTILLDGFSKAYAMTGWRLGYGVMPEWLVAAVNKLMVNSNSCTATFTQRAGLAALQGPQDDVERMVAEFARRRALFCAGLNSIPGFRCGLPGGAFYAWADVSGTPLGSREMADRLLSEAGVACLNGSSFGSKGEGFLRFSYANSFEKLSLALERIRSFVEAVARAA